MTPPKHGPKNLRREIKTGVKKHVPWYAKFSKFLKREIKTGVKNHVPWYTKFLKFLKREIKTGVRIELRRRHVTTFSQSRM